MFCCLLSSRMETRLGFNFRWVGFFCVDPSQNILIPDYITHEVKVFDSTGKLLFILGGKGSNNGKFIKPKAIAYSSGTLVVICNKFNGRVQVFSHALSSIQ